MNVLPIRERAILVTGALGQLGSELVPALRARYGEDRVIASDVRAPTAAPSTAGRQIQLDCTDCGQLFDTVRRYDIGAIYHLAALLSATGEGMPQAAWNLNMGSLYNVLEAARERRCSVFFPSSIAAFGPSTPPVGTPQVTVQRPETMYGITKLAGELLCDYYARRYDVDTRGVRFPGLISHVIPPGGGTTDYAVDIFDKALRSGHFTCFLNAGTPLEMMYMPDAIRAVIELMETGPARLRFRNAYNVAAMSFTPAELAAEIRKHIPAFRIEYRIDPVRQAIADGWPDSLDDSAALQDWGWRAQFDLAAMTSDMLAQVWRRLTSSGAMPQEPVEAGASNAGAAT